MTFKELGLRNPILKAVTELGFEQPTPIQEQAIPHLLQKECDLVGLAQTGTGKTAAFGLPLINRISGASNKPVGLVICPTRELCLQITGDIENYSKYEKHIKVVAVYGGADIRKQMRKIKDGASIIVATPGRLVDLINRKAIHLDEVEVVVFDEADEMLDMGFKDDLDSILAKTPSTKNTWLFSATMPKEVEKIANTYMKNPLEVSIGNKNEANKNIEHIYFCVKEKDRYLALKRLIDYNPDIFGLIFCRTRRETQEIAEKLGKEGYNAEALHGDLSQAQRDRVMNLFRNRSIQLLVATDVAARGIDVDEITHVINYKLPDEIESYTHRSGRTARAGNKGESLVLINTREVSKIRQIEKIIGREFINGGIPSAEAICASQLGALIDRVRETEVKEKEISPFLPQIYEDLAELSKEEVIKLFVSAEFNRFLNYYKKAGDLNATPSKSSVRSEGRGNQKGRRRRDDENQQRFFVSLGEKDGLNRGALLRLVCDSTSIDSKDIGRIDVMPAFSFFNVDKRHTDTILRELKENKFDGKPMTVEKTEDKGRGSRGGNRSRGRGRGKGQGRGNAQRRR
ncbi:MAG: DEAD/DEAH box helicase [Brumimicrobium sp.]